MDVFATQTAWEPHDIADWMPNPGPQTVVLTRPEFEILYGGARGGGKTEAGLAWMIEPDYVNHPKYRGLVIRRNADDLSDWVARARDFYGSVGANFAGKPPIIKFPSGAFIRTGHLRDENAYTKYQGHEYQKILIEELTQIPEELRYLRLIASCRTTVPDLKPGVFATTNPGGVGHAWVKERWVDVANCKTYYETREVLGRKISMSRIFIPSKVEDTPQLVMYDPQYIAFLDSLPEDLRRAWRDGDWDVFEGQYFSRWRNEIHVIEPFTVPLEWSRIIALDWGYSPHPYSVGWYAIDFDPIPNIFKYREKFGVKSSPTMLAQTIMRLSAGEPMDVVVGDTQMWVQNPFSDRQAMDHAYTDKSIADQIIAQGIPLMQANKDRVNGWVNMKTLLEWEGKRIENGEYMLTKSPRLRYFKTCTQSIKEIPIQVHDDKRPIDMAKKNGDWEREIPGDDGPDTDRYALMHFIGKEKPKTPRTPVQKFLQTEDHSQPVYAEEGYSGGGDMDS